MTPTTADTLTPWLDEPAPVIPPPNYSKVYPASRRAKIEWHINSLADYVEEAPPMEQGVLVAMFFEALRLRGVDVQECVLAEA